MVRGPEHSVSKYREWLRDRYRSNCLTEVLWRKAPIIYSIRRRLWRQRHILPPLAVTNDILVRNRLGSARTRHSRKRQPFGSMTSGHVQEDLDTEVIRTGKQWQSSKWAAFHARHTLWHILNKKRVYTHYDSIDTTQAVLSVYLRVSQGLDIKRYHIWRLQDPVLMNFKQWYHQDELVPTGN